MKIINKISELKTITKELKKDDKIIGFVPTMGALHEGHLKLVKKAKKISDFVIVSIFINPTQFGKNEDLDKYPRDINGDSQKLKDLGVDIVFFPDAEEIYPENYQTVVSLSKITKGLCGDRREGHFDGVATIVLKLFNIVTPNFAFFGLKDYQQFVLIKQLVKDLNLDIKIIGIEIVREEDGLAMSSRNLNLTKSGRKKAGLINKVIKSAISKFKSKVENFENSDFIIEYIQNNLEKEGFTIDYIELRDRKNLITVHSINEDSMIFIAVFIDNVRLIDNFSFGEIYD